MIKSLYIKENTDHVTEYTYICSFDTSYPECVKWLDDIVDFYENNYWMINIIKETNG